MAKKILLVDDDKDFLSITRSYIKKGGYDVEVAYNGQKCLKKARSSKPDLILLDVMMPDQSGFDVCKKLKSDKNTKSIPVILLTAHVNDACNMIYRHEDLETEADDYMGKPVNPERLLQLISELIDDSDSTMREQSIDLSENNKLIKIEKELKSDFPLKNKQHAKATFYANEFVALKAFSDGSKYLFRPVKLADNELLLKLFNALEEKSVAFPFFQLIKTSPQEVIQKLINIDYSKEMAIGVFIQEKGKEQIIGIGYYKLIPKSKRAEISFIISDLWKEKRVGRYLLKIITEIANKHGIVGFEAKVYSNNKEILSLFCDSGYKVSYHCLDVLQQDSCNVMM